MDAGRLGYTFFMGLATLTAGWLYRRGESTSRMPPHQAWGIAIGALVGATFAAKLPFLLGGNAGGSVLGAWLGDGKTILWGLAGGYAGVELAKWSLHVQTRTGDRFVVPVAAAIAIGRGGCLFAGCCYGAPTNQSWGIRSALADGGAVLRHPVALYESAFHAAMALLAWWGIRRGLFSTRWMLIYLVAYCVFRFISEWWRDEPVLVAGLTFYQVSAVVIGAVFASILSLRSIPSAGRPSGE